MTFNIKTKQILLPYVSALLLSGAFWMFDLGWLAFVAFVPMIYFFTLSPKLKITPRQQKKHMFWAGTLFFLSIFSWKFYTKPISWTPVEGTDATATKFLLIAFIIFFNAFFWWLFTYGLIKTKTFKKKPVKLMIFFIGLWTLTEFLRSVSFSIVMYSSDATIGPHWNFGNLAFASAPTPLIYASRILGMYGLGALVLLCNFAIFYLLKKKFNYTLAIVSACFVFALLGYGLFQPKVSTEKVSVGALQINADLADGYMDHLNQATQNETQDVIVMPEYSEFYRSYDLEDNDEYDKDRTEVLDKIAHDDSIIITSEDSSTDQLEKKNLLKYYDKYANELAVYEKSFLIPGGEYLPTWVSGLSKAAGHTSLIDSFNNYVSVNKGENPEQPITTKSGLTVGSLICSGIVSPRLYQNSAGNQNPDILTNSASLGVFKDSRQYFEQTKQMATFHAVANSKPFAQATREGESLILDHNGNVLVASNRHEPADYLTASVQPNNQQTLFTRSPFLY